MEREFVLYDFEVDAEKRRHTMMTAEAETANRILRAEGSSLRWCAATVVSKSYWRNAMKNAVRRVTLQKRYPILTKHVGELEHLYPSAGENEQFADLYGEDVMKLIRDKQEKRNGADNRE